ncbi:hypothetical protein RQP46_008075 [Phenoliferia psychrophenolica]
MVASITDQLQQLQLAPAPPRNPSGQTKRHSRGRPRRPARSSKTRPATLPPELFAEIINLTVEILLEEERHLASQIPLTNRFLLSAALVNRTWHSIASLALLKSGLVTPRKAYRFFEMVGQRNMTETLDRVRFGAGPAGLDRSPLAEGEVSDDRIFQALISSLPGLKTIEFVGIGLRFSGDCFGFRSLELVFANTNSTAIFMYITKLAPCPPPLRLSIIETRGRVGKVWYWVLEPVAFQYLARTPHLVFRTNQLPKSIYLLLAARFGSAHAEAGTNPCLRSFRLEAPLERPWDTTDRGYFQTHINNSHFPYLMTISTQLDPLHLFATNGNRPALTSLEVLPEGFLNESSTRAEEVDIKLLGLIKKLPVLRTLQVPACWRSETVEEACRAKGIELRWT